MPKTKSHAGLREQLCRVAALVILTNDAEASAELLETLVDLAHDYPSKADLARAIAEETAP